MPWQAFALILLVTKVFVYADAGCKYTYQCEVNHMCSNGKCVHVDSLQSCSDWEPCFDDAYTCKDDRCVIVPSGDPYKSERLLLKPSVVTFFDQLTAIIPDTGDGAVAKPKPAAKTTKTEATGASVETAAETTGATATTTFSSATVPASAKVAVDSKTTRLATTAVETTTNLPTTTTVSSTSTLLTTTTLPTTTIVPRTTTLPTTTVLYTTTLPTTTTASITIPPTVPSTTAAAASTTTTLPTKAIVTTTLPTTTDSPTTKAAIETTISEKSKTVVQESKADEVVSSSVPTKDSANNLTTNLATKESSPNEKSATTTTLRFIAIVQNSGTFEPKDKKTVPARIQAVVATSNLESAAETKECKDEFPRCDLLKRHCRKMISFMKKHCEQTCGYCGCEDNDKICSLSITRMRCRDPHYADDLWPKCWLTCADCGRNKKPTRKPYRSGFTSKYRNIDLMDCSHYAHQCSNPKYDTFMKLYCPKTCENNARPIGKKLPEKDENCVDSDWPYDNTNCTANADLCGSPTLYHMMTLVCPRTCNRCEEYFKITGKRPARYRKRFPYLKRYRYRLRPQRLQELSWKRMPYYLHI